MRLLLSHLFVFALWAQISPGPLSKPHQDLGGPIGCTNCHVFGTGSPRLRCLNCHTEIRERVARRAGYHGRVANLAKGDIDCARCHTEHYGVNFYIIRWPTVQDEFDHRETGYPLEGRHANLRCAQCHNAKHVSAVERRKIKIKDANRTFLGLSTACQTCHQDPHRGQFPAGCGQCHDFAGWKPARRFDHSRTAFPLTGKHEAVECAKCHRAPAGQAIRYKGLEFQACSSCHQDAHRGAFPQDCRSCHNTSSWKQVRLSENFDHNRTRFPLAGKHASVNCFKCHRDVNFKAPLAHARCLDCHRDEHGGQFRARKDEGDCAACHDERGFRPSTFTRADHQSARFPLAGGHAPLDCAKCHRPAGAKTDYRPAFERCSDCHRDPHTGQFAARRCEDCHGVEAFRPSSFTLVRHQKSRFPLEGAHAAVPCGECHKDQPVRYRFAETRCQTCHRNPHGTDFRVLASPGEVCHSCHTLKSWRDVREFDHAVTGFVLAGTHRAVACVDCHKTEFSHTPKRCSGCHEDVHGGQFERDCDACHTSVHWLSARFDHSKDASFPLTGAHERVPCRLCHKQSKEANGRTVIAYRGTPSACAACHSQ